MFGFDFQKAPDSSYSGISTHAGQQLLAEIKPANVSTFTTNMPDPTYTTLHSDGILEIKDLGLKVYGYSKQNETTKI